MIGQTFKTDRGRRSKVGLAVDKEEKSEKRKSVITAA